MKRRALISVGLLVVLLCGGAGIVVWKEIVRAPGPETPPPVRAEGAVGTAPVLEGQGTAPRTEGEGLPPPMDLATLDRLLDLHGVVVREDGVPVAGAWVGSFVEPWGRASVLTDPGTEKEVGGRVTKASTDGSFWMRLRRGTTVNLRIEAEGFASALVRDCQPGQRLRIVLRHTVALVVLATDPEGRPLEGVEITLERRGSEKEPGFSRKGSTDASGRVRWADLPAGATATLEASHGALGGIAMDWDGVALPQRGEATHRIVVPPGHVVTGRVTDKATGQPVEGARVGMGWTFFKEVRTDGDGRYAIGGWIGNYYHDIHVVADGYARAISTPVEMRTSIDFALERGFSIEGRIVGEGAGPLAGAQVAAVGATFDGLFQRISFGAVRTDAAGRFRVADLTRDLPHTLVVMAEGFGRWLLLVPAEPTRERVDVGDVEVPRGRLLSGIVYDEEGSPRAGAYVSLTGSNDAPGTQEHHYGRMEERTTDHAGRFTFADLSPGMYVVSAGRHGEAQAAVEVALRPDDDVEGLQIRYERKQTLRVEVVDPSGAPVPGLSVFLSPSEGESAYDTTDASGKATFLLLREASFVTASLFGLPDVLVRAPDEVKITLPRDEYRIVLEAAVFVRGRILDPQGAPLPQASILALRGGDIVDYAQSDGSGAFLLRLPPGGPVDVRFRGEGNWKGRKALRAFRAQVPMEGGEIVLRTEEAPADRGLEVRVEDGDGNAVARAEVRVSPIVGRAPAVVVADEQGIARFTLTADPVDVIAAPPKEHSLSGSAARAKEVTPGGERVTLRIEPPLALEGEVFDPDGRPAKGVQIQVQTYLEEASSTKSDETGHFRLLLPTDVGTSLQVQAFASSDGRLRFFASRNGVDPRKGPLRIALRPHRGW